jgi:LysM repeat protein
MRRFLCLMLLLLVLVGGTIAVSAQDGQVIHTVAPGETLYRISLRYNVSVSAIASANGISNVNLIFVGQQLRIPGATGGTTPPPPPPPPGETTTYTVQRGDTLASIARRFNTTVASIASLNGITNVNLIFVGQQLRISGSGPGDGGVVQPPPPPPPGGFSGFMLGGHVSSFAFPDQMRSAGMSWAKRQIRWNLGEGTGAAEAAINSARERGFRIVLGVMGNKDQLAGNPTQYYQDFANYLANVARLNPDAIEVWNEPNIDREWPAGQVSGGNYTQMLSAAYQAIKAANPNVVVISGAPAPTGFFGGTCQAGGCDDNVFIQQMANAGAARFMDCVGIHYNEGILPPSARSGDPRGNSGHYTRYFMPMLELYSRTFPSKPLCFTEIGYLTPEGFGPLPGGFSWASNTTVAQQAQWLGDAVRLARQSGRVRLFIIWNVDFTSYGADPQAGYAIVRNGNCTACASLAAAMR